MSRPRYFTRQRLAQLGQNLSERDRQILTALQRCRYLTTLQMARLYFFGESVSHRAAVRAANRSLARLRDDGLIRALSRRIGGVRAGSGSFVWALAPGGFRLLTCADSPQPRKQFREPTVHFLAHTLVISEAYLQLTEICAQHGMTLADAQFEPDCWRRYADRGGGKQVLLKPDLYAVTQGGGYEDCWFIEIDCDTETVARIVDKCERYMCYLRSGAEQERTGVFPYVVWTVPDGKRKDSIEKHIRLQYPHGPEIFIVILPDELEALIRKGANI